MNPNPYDLRADLPAELDDLRLLALDLRWCWSHAADALWQRIDENLWKHTRNPTLILQTVSLQRLNQLVDDAEFRRQLQQLRKEQNSALSDQNWFQQNHADESLSPVAYFCMEFGISEALPLYSGGLGILAGDHLKTCSELGVPVRAIGLLYQQGYFRQALNDAGEQLAFYPFNDPSQLPVTPLRTRDGEWLSLSIALPGRELHLRAWQIQLGRVLLYLLDSNDPLNDPADRGITSELYGGGSERRLQQEMVLGIGGYRLLKRLEQTPDICHLNEGHAAFAILERARVFMQQAEVDFQTALIATRAGNLFTTHTPVAAGFDRFPADLLKQYLGSWASEAGIDWQDVLALGRSQHAATAEPFNMAWLAIHGSGAINAVSRLHGCVSQQLFQPLFPRWPGSDVPVSYVTNGVHIPSWDSPDADRLWTEACGKERWREDLRDIEQLISKLSAMTIWEMRSRNRLRLLTWIRQRQPHHQIVGSSTEILLDPNILTLGFARRFATYKRPNLLLHDQQRLLGILSSSARPVQLVIAGKAHPQDHEGQAMIRDWIQFINQHQLQSRVIFLVDYDLLTAEYLVQGVDVWINTPRRPWEACGTSGMKVLVNGGLNFSELDGWWAEAWRPEVGWAMGDRQEHAASPEIDAQEAEILYRTLEQKVIPEFYLRNARGIPERWIDRIRHSMAELTPTYSSNRMVREYTEQYYLPMAQRYRNRSANQAAMARDIHGWQQTLQQHWSGLHFGNVLVTEEARQYHFQIQLYLDDLNPESVQVELYAEPSGTQSSERHTLQQTQALPGSINGYLYAITIPARRPSADYTTRVVPVYKGVVMPLELNLILWQH